MGTEFDSARRGFLATLITAVQAALAALLGTSSSCVTSGDGDVAPRPDANAGDACYADMGTDYGYRPDDGGTTPPPDDDARSGCYADGDADYWSPEEDAEPADGGPESDAGDVPAPGDDVPGDAADVSDPDEDGTGGDVVEPADGASDAIPDGDVPDGDLPPEWAGLSPDERRRRLDWARRTVARSRAVRALLADAGTDPTVRGALRAEQRPLRRWTVTARRWLAAGPGGRPMPRRG